MTENHWEVTVEEDPETGDLILPFPVDFLAQVGWNPGDQIKWLIEDDNQVILVKKES